VYETITSFYQNLIIETEVIVSFKYNRLYKKMLIQYKLYCINEVREKEK